MEIIDAHVHVLSADTARYPTLPGLGDTAQGPPAGAYGPISPIWYRITPLSAQKLLAEMADAGVMRTVLAQPLSVYGHDNAYTVDSARAHHDQLAGVGSIDVTQADPGAALAHWLARGMHGARLAAADSAHLRSLMDARFDGFWRLALERQLPINIQTRLADAEALAAVVAAHPALRFAMDHIGCVHVVKGLGPESLSPLAPLARLPNLTIKYSTLNINAAETAEGAARLVHGLVAMFGTERIVWSSNYPATIDASYARLVERGRESTAKLGAADRVLVLGGNARRQWWND